MDLELLEEVKRFVPYEIAFKIALYAIFSLIYSIFFAPIRRSANQRYQIMFAI
jgi:hypothetical protein